MRPLGPFVYLPLLISVVSQVCICHHTCEVVHTGCACTHTRAYWEYTLSPTTGCNQGHGAAAASPPLGYWSQPSQQTKHI